MAPVAYVARDALTDNGSSMALGGALIEAWAQGFNVGGLIILMLFVVCNYRRGVILHKLIILEILLALGHGTFIFFPDPIYNWYLSSTALLLFISYQVHNFVSYLKIRLFLPRWGRRVFIVTLICIQPYWVLETVSNFEFWNGTLRIWPYTRPLEPLAREPWWIFTTCFLIYQIKSKYQLSARALLQISPRFSIMMLCMFLSIAFLVADAIVTIRNLSAEEGVNPFWRISLVFKAAADTVFLDDFKSVLDKIMAQRSGSGGFFRPTAPFKPAPMSTTAPQHREDAPLAPPPKEDDARATTGWFSRKRHDDTAAQHIEHAKLSSDDDTAAQHIEHAKLSSDDESGYSEPPWEMPNSRLPR